MQKYYDVWGESLATTWRPTHSENQTGLSETHETHMKGDWEIWIQSSASPCFSLLSVSLFFLRSFSFSFSLPSSTLLRTFAFQVFLHLKMAVLRPLKPVLEGCSHVLKLTKQPCMWHTYIDANTPHKHQHTETHIHTNTNPQTHSLVQPNSTFPFETTLFPLELCVICLPWSV